jgi:hypothetical protein
LLFVSSERGDATGARRMSLFCILSLSFAILISSEALPAAANVGIFYCHLRTYPPACKLIDARGVVLCALFGLKNYAPSWGALQIKFNKLYPEHIGIRC